MIRGPGIACGALVIALGRAASAYSGDAADGTALADALALERAGECRGAIPMARSIAERVASSPHRDEARFLLGRCLEAVGDPSGAAAVYRDLLSRRRLSVSPAQVAFRLGAALIRASDPAGAERAFRAVLRQRDLDVRDEGVTRVHRGLALARLGRHRAAVGEVERGLRLVEGLDAGTDELVRVSRAIGQVAYGEVLLQHAERVRLKGSSEAAVSRAVERRAALAVEAERVLGEVAALRSPTWACEALLDLGTAYERFYAAVLASPAPRGLDPAQRDAYRTGLRARYEPLARKSLQALSGAAAVAAQEGVPTPCGPAAAERAALLEDVLLSLGSPDAPVP